jgi:hypothetical protein
MNQERFDDITRHLATSQLSRRQVLKALGAGALLSGPLSTLSANPVSAACPEDHWASCSRLGHGKSTALLISRLWARP